MGVGAVAADEALDSNDCLPVSMVDAIASRLGARFCYSNASDMFFSSKEDDHLKRRIGVVT